MPVFKTKTVVASLLSAAAVTTTAIGVGVGVSNQQESSPTTTIKHDENVSEPNVSVGNKNELETTTGNSLSEKDDDEEGVETEYTPSPELLDAISKLKQSDIKFVKGLGETESLTPSETYAFNLTRNNIKLEVQDKTISKEVQFTYRTTSASNTVENLNQGIFSVVVVALNKGTAENASKEFTFNNFKKADTSLTDLFEDKKAVLNLIDDKQKQNPIYVTINDLNEDVKKIASKETEPKYPRSLGIRNSSLEKMSEVNNINGLNYLFKYHSSFSSEKKREAIKNVSIQGGIYLDDIKKDESKNAPVFELSGDGIDVLKLVKKDDSNPQKIVGEAAISKIKVANLLPTDISLIPADTNWDQTREYIAKLTKDDKAQNGFLKLEHNDSQLTRNLYVNIKGEEESNELSVFVKPFVIDKPSSSEIKFNYQIGFGRDGMSRLLLSTLKTDVELLKQLGFSFITLTKKLDTTETPIKAETFSNIQDLNKLFNEKNVTEPIDSTSLASTPSGFVKQEVKSSDLANEITVKLNEIESGDMKSNYIIATGISYSGMNENNVVIAPSVSIVISNQAKDK